MSLYGMVYSVLSNLYYFSDYGVGYLVFLFSNHTYTKILVSYIHTILVYSKYRISCILHKQIMQSIVFDICLLCN